MKPATVFSLAFVAATQIFGAYAATKTTAVVPTQRPSTAPIADQLTSHGCYKSQGNLTVAKAVRSFLTSGSCWEYCKGKDYLVMGLHATSCYCGMVYPPEIDLTDDKKCNYSCPGYPQESCGGLVDGIFSIWNTGIDVLVDDMEPVETTTSAAESTTKASKSSDATEAATTTADSPAETTTDGGDSDKKSGPNTAAIAAGSVVGVLAVLALAGAAVFFVRRRRNAEIEEEHRRNAAVNAFINGSKPPGSSGSISMTDSRLDPVMAHRRLSDGSIADNQDYSRRILRVTNA
ncbi:Protein SLG1 [Neonectria punicea]|uniref:Protein SLG1 n=1 Tax=Neonectria punicea TaxID=979145 RepID=A0ABR1H1P6_9HYPO